MQLRFTSCEGRGLEGTSNLGWLGIERNLFDPGRGEVERGANGAWAGKLSWLVKLCGEEADGDEVDRE
jgi:hypothetical protein